MGSTVRARDLMRRAATLLNDDNLRRWRASEMRRWINDGMREIAARKPDACSKRVTLVLDQGSGQDIGPLNVALLRVTRNIVGDGDGGSAITPVAREMMDASNPDWHSEDVVAPKRAVVHVVYDEADTRRFFVYPPNDGTGKVEIIASRYPEEVPAPVSNGNLVENYPGVLDIEDIYVNALLEYLMFRCYGKDSQSPAAAARSEAHWAQFMSALGGKAGSEAQNPNARTA